MKYKIMHSEDPVSDKEIRSFQSFEKLLDQRKQYLSRRALYRKLMFGTAVVSLMVAVLVYYYLSGTVPQNTNTKAPVAAAKQQQAPVGQESEKSVETKGIPSEGANKPVPESAEATRSVSGKEPVKKPDPVISKKQKPVSGKPSGPVQDVEKTAFREASPAGGYPSLFDFFQKSLRYPEQARKDSITGTVVIGFAINAAGKPQDLEVIKSVNPALDQEALRLVSQMPRWNPALLNGKPVTTRQTVPLTFQLSRFSSK